MGSGNATNPLPSLIRASAWDAGNASMRAAGRKTWSVDDYNAAARCQNHLVCACFGEGPAGYVRSAVADALEAAGELSLSMTGDQFRDAILAAMEPAAAAHPEETIHPTTTGETR